MPSEPEQLALVLAWDGKGLDRWPGPPRRRSVPAPMVAGGATAVRRSTGRREWPLDPTA